MTSEVYRVLLMYVKCPRCHRQYTKDDFIMWGDAHGYELEDGGFHYTLLGNCKSCKLISSLKELGIPQLNSMDEVDSFVSKLRGGPDAKVKSSDKIANGGGS